MFYMLNVPYIKWLFLTQGYSAVEKYKYDITTDPEVREYLGTIMPCEGPDCQCNMDCRYYSKGGCLYDG